MIACVLIDACVRVRAHEDLTWRLIRAKRPLRLVSTERPFLAPSEGLRVIGGPMSPPRGTLEKKALSMGVSEVDDGRRARPGRAVQPDLLEEAYLPLPAFALPVDVHPGTHP